MIATNTVAPISAMLKALIQKIREDVRMKAEFGGTRDAKRADQDVIHSTEQTLNEADDVLAPLTTEEERIQADPDTSDAGKVKRMIESVARYYARLQFVGKKAKETRAASIAAAEALKEVPKADTDVVVDALIGIEVRGRLRTLPEPERMKVFTNALKAKNTMLERAVMNDPFGDLIPTEIMDRMRDEFLQDTRAKEWRRMETLTFAAEKLEVLAGAIEANLGSYGQAPTFQAKPFRTSDLKSQDTQAPPPKNPAVDVPPPSQPKFQ